MKVPLEWLKEFVTVRLAPEALAERLTMAGLEVTGIQRLDGEPVLDLEITPNRADCLSIIGIAREVSAITGVKLKLPSLAQGSRLKAQGKKPRASSLEPRAKLTIRIEDPQGCRRYIGRLIEGVRIGPSPEWMQKRLAACGLRPINNVVDITNYVLLEWGQPLHAFDYDRLDGGTIIVRRVRGVQLIETLDGVTQDLREGQLVIADRQGPVAVAGVMGGQGSQVTPSTTRVLLESAWFDPILVRRTARALGLSTESSYRFERGVDLDGVAAASRRASSLISQLAQGRETLTQDVGLSASRPVEVRLEAGRVNRWLGTSLSSAQTSRALERVGCTVRNQGVGWRVRAPSWRRDLRQDVDLIEEVARLIGYDRLPTSRPCVQLGIGAGQATSHARAQELRRLCTGLGLSEIVTWSLISDSSLERLGWSAQRDALVKLRNPLSRDHAVLRPTLLVGMLQATSKNLAQGTAGARLFELGHTFSSATESGGIQERLRLGIGIAGSWERSWQGARAADLFRLKGLFEELVNRAAHQTLSAEAVSLPWAEPGQSMELRLGQQRLGTVGQVARRVCEAYDCEEPVWFGELEAEVLLEPPITSAPVVIPGAFPPLKRDLSVLVDKRVACATLLGVIRDVGSPLASQIELIDRYTGANIPDSKHSVTVSIHYCDPARTLTAEEVEPLHQRIVQALTQRFGAQLR